MRRSKAAGALLSCWRSSLSASRMAGIGAWRRTAVDLTKEARSASDVAQRSVRARGGRRERPELWGWHKPGGARVVGWAAERETEKAMHVVVAGSREA